MSSVVYFWFGVGLLLAGPAATLVYWLIRLSPDRWWLAAGFAFVNAERDVRGHVRRRPWTQYATLYVVEFEHRIQILEVRGADVSIKPGA